jgi:hypothetical protein
MYARILLTRRRNLINKAAYQRGGLIYYRSRLKRDLLIDSEEVIFQRVVDVILP